MSSPRLPGLITVCLLLSCRIVLGIDPTQSTNPIAVPATSAEASPTSSPPSSTSMQAGTIGPTDIGNTTTTPSLMALPANATTNGPGIDAANIHKFYTFSVSLREAYDTNVNTSSFQQKSALETTLSPTILVDFPMENTEFSANYTFGATYYSQTGGTGSTLQYSNQFIAQLKHDFSERFSLNASDQLLDSSDPDIFASVGTPYRQGYELSNSFTSGLNAQWTPIVGTQTTYANTLVRYERSVVGAYENSDENTASQTVSFATFPTVSLSLGGIFDTISYVSDPRGYTTYTGFVGGTWQALPSVTASLRGGGEYTQVTQDSFFGGTVNETEITPYVDLNGSWQIGKRSSLTADYSHEITPGDSLGSNGEESDRVTGNFNYAITTQLSAHLQLSYTYSDISGAFLANEGQPGYTETVYAVDGGLSYSFIKYLSLSFDINQSGVSSTASAAQDPYLNYNRTQVSFGVRGTY